MRRTLALASLALGVVTTTGHAQYFGRNKVQYRHLDFAVIRTEHFDIYYYEEERDAAVDGARMAERAYARLSRILNHRYRERQPIILFASHSEFQQNNVTNIGETTGGVTEPFRHRVLLPFTGSYASFEHVLQHEIVHQFQFDIFARGSIGGGIQRLVSVNPPLWFMEGMAEYLSLGPITPQTAMWLRDAALEGGLPSIEQMTWDPRYSPYRFGHALWSYVGERWGDETVGELLHAASVSGIEAAFQRALGLRFNDLVEQWHDAIQRTYLPQIIELQKARHLARPVLTERRSRGSLHISPSISPDGTEIAYLSEGNSFFIDLYLADAETGQVKRRLIKSAFSTAFESLRFLNSSGAWSPDGRLFAIAVKRGGADDLVIFDIQRNRVHGRLHVPLHGVTTPSWSPDGTKLVFTGYSGGYSDLFVINADGTNLERLTRDPYADLHPVWSPDGATIAFATDRGPGTDLSRLRFAPMSIATYRMNEQVIEVLEGMAGDNTNPQWAPDGQSLAFVSDRTGIPNVFLYDLNDRATYQLTNVFTGTSGVTPLSPTMSWAPRADRLVFTYYEKGEFNVYGIDNPRSLKGRPYDAATPRPIVASLMRVPPPPPPPPPLPRDSDRAAAPKAVASLPLADRSPADSTSASSAGAAPQEAALPVPKESSLYRRGDTFRASDSTPDRPTVGPRSISVKALLDSATLALPDTSEFTFRDYSAKLSPDYIVQPSVGYVRDNFGSGFFAGSAISLSDMLGNRRLHLAGQVNGRIDEAMLLGVYANLSRRTNWAAGVAQTPYFFSTGTVYAPDSTGNVAYNLRLERFVTREIFAAAYRPFDRFRRLEVGLRAVNISHAALDYMQVFDPALQAFRLDREVEHLGNFNYLQPSVALVFDNSIHMWVGPALGRRSRFEYAPAIGDWRYHQVLADYRRYDGLVGPFTLATRALFFGRFGRDDSQFPIFLGIPELIRGYTAGSLRDNECRQEQTGPSSSCGALDQLTGSRLAVFNAELRFPLLHNARLGFAPIGFPPVEGAIFFDAGIAWNDRSTIVWKRSAGDNKELLRAPLYAWGISVRGNLLGFIILRADYAKPLTREGQGSYWTLSIGPTF